MLKKTGSVSEIGSAARTVIFIGASVMAVLLIIGGIYIFQKKNEENPAGQAKPSVDKGFSELIVEGTQDREYEDMQEMLDVTLDEAFSIYSENDTYYHECTVLTVGADGTKHERVKRILRDGEKYNIRTYNKNTLIETIKCDGNNILIVNETTGAINKASLSPDITPMELASMPSHEYLLALLEEYRDGGENTVLSSADYSITRTRDMNILDVAVKYRASGITEKYVYYLNYGIIYDCDSTAENGAKPYSMSTTYFNRSIADFVTEDSFLTN